MEHKMAPPILHVLQPFDPLAMARLCDVPPPLLPQRWRELMVNYVGQRHRPQGKSPIRPHPTTTPGTPVGVWNYATPPESVRRRRSKKRPRKVAEASSAEGTGRNAEVATEETGRNAEVAPVVTPPESPQLQSPDRVVGHLEHVDPVEVNWPFRFRCLKTDLI